MCGMLFVTGRVRGVSSLDNIMYAFCDDSSAILLYDMDTQSPIGTININGMKAPQDIVFCRDDRQLYVADSGCLLWRVSVDDHSDQEKWLSTEPTKDNSFSITSLSVASRRLLVTSLRPPSLYLYNTADKQQLHHLQLPEYVKGLHHSVETTRGTFIICHYGTAKDEFEEAVSELFLPRDAL